jgi:hypothetical protein
MANAVGHLQAGGSGLGVGMRKLNIRKLSDDQALKKIESLVAKVSVSSGGPAPNTSSTLPSDVVVPMPLDFKTLRVYNLPFNFGVDEVLVPLSDSSLCTSHDSG